MEKDLKYLRTVPAKVFNDSHIGVQMSTIFRSYSIEKQQVTKSLATKCMLWKEIAN